MNRLITRLAIFLTFALLVPVTAHATLSMAPDPLTWNIIGLDSNDPLTGPRHFPVGARVCSDVATTNVSVSFLFDTANASINLRTGSLSTVILPSISAGGCADAFFEVEVTPVPAAYDTTRRYHITATDFSGTVSTVTPRELYVEHLISQSRNSVSDVSYGPTILSLTSVPPGGGLSLVVGNTYVVQLTGGTATQGYNQFEEFINFSNAIFQILSVSTTYSADNSPFVPNPNDKLYADACLWENDPNSPNYRSCVGGDFKAGGSTVVTTYTIRIVGGGGTNQTLNTLLYDFSGSSYHYNADFSVGARTASIIDPTAATISKTFSPNPAPINGVSALTITLTNPNGATLGGYNFVDNLPANLVVATPPAATTSGCGTPTLTAVGGSSTISFSNGTLAANSNCVIKVNVTPTATGLLTNTTNNLFVGTIDTGNNATAPLTVNNEPPAGTGLCAQNFATWTFPTGFAVASPPASSGIFAGTATATPGAGMSNPMVASTNSTIGPADGTTSWGSNGSITTGATLVTANDEYYEFGVDTTGVTSVTLNFNARFRGGQGPTGIAVFFGTTAKTSGATEASGSIFDNPTVLSTQNIWQAIGPITVNTGLNPSGKTFFRIYSYNSGQTNGGQDSNIDNVAFTGCSAGVKPTIAKSFSPDPIAVNGVSTLTFTLTNPNAAILTGANFTDSLPAGVQVAAVPAASTTCGGVPTWAPTAGATTLTFGTPTGATIPASGSCTVSVNVTATTAGPHGNVSGFLVTTETGTSTGGVATDTLTAVLPPSIAKQFAPTPILAGGTSTLTFTITNPNQDNAISGVAFSDTLPVAPGAMTVASPPNASTSGCGAPVFSPVAGAGSLTFTGGTIAGGGTCTVTVNVTASTVGTYNNTTGNVSHVINAQVVNGNTASDSLEVDPPDPSIALLKQVGTSITGPWSTFEAVSAGNVFFRFVIENTGDVPLTPITVTDNTLDVSGCNATLIGVTLPVAVAANDNHIVECVVGPVPITPGSHTNTAHATGTFGGNPFDSEDSSATFATTGLTIDKSAVQSTFTTAGDVINYNYLVTNSGFAPLAAPVTVSDDKTTVTCPAVNTVGDLDNFFDPGESMTCTAIYVITAGDVTSAFVTNTASATADGVSSGTDSTTVVLNTAADVSVVKTLTTNGPFTIGQSITYTLFVANAGPSTATNVQVTDTPSNLTITNVSGGGCAALPCTIPSIAALADVTITVTATINAAGAFDNSVTVTATEPDPNTTNNTDNTGNGGTAAAEADVSVVKTLTTAGPFTVGQSITYTLFVANAGPSTATNVQVTDTPSNLTITNVSGGGCAALPCTIPSIAALADVTITVTATINAAGAFDNTANVTATEPDPNTGNNTDNTSNGGTAAASADVSVVKTLTTAGPFTVSQTITYTLFVANAGPSTATNVQVTDAPSNLTITNVSGGGCAALPCTIPSIAALGDVTITVTATIDEPGDFDNSATVSATEPDPNSGNNTDNTGNGGTAAESADVSVVKTLTTAGPFTVGQTITYTLLVANAGPSTATDILVTDTLTNLTITNVSGGGCAALPCTVALLTPLTDVTITVTATIDAAGAFDNTVTVAATEPDPNTTNNTDDTGNNGITGASADVSVVKTLTTAGPFIPGQSITYTLFVANAGPSTATNVQVTDTPSNLTITNVSGGGCAALPCTIPSLAALADTTITVTATIDAAGSFNNSATVTATEPDPDPSDNTDNTGNGGEAAPLADVSIVKTLTTGGPFTLGQSITYTLLVANAGPSTATSVQVTDTPTNLTITNVSGGGCAALPCTIPSIASLADVTITVTATIDAEGAFDNSATVTATEPDPNTGNNTDNTGNGGQTVPSADVSVVKTLTTAGPFTVGQTITYTLFVANAGPSTATDIQVTDTPTNLTITNVSGGGCAALPCTIALLTPLTDVTITVTATIDAAGAFDNTASATAKEPDPDTSNNTDNTGNNGVTGASADVSVVKTLTTAGPFIPGQSITYTLFVANAGPSTATSVQVTDTPTNLTITNVSGGGCAALPCTIPSIASLADVTITVTATIDAAGSFNNSATVTATETDPDPTDNTDNTGNGGEAAPSADVSVVKTLTTAGPFIPGQSITYTLFVANAGPSTATSVQVTDTPSNLTITNVSGGGCAALPCTIPSIASLADVTITVTATINAAGAFDNSVTVTATEPDPNTTNNTDNTGNGGTAAASADVSVVKTLTTVGPFTVGQSITYTLFVANAGPSTATSVQVTDTPTNLTITNVSGGGCAALPCTIPSIASLADVTITVTATIDAVGAFDNSATVTATEPDPDPTDNTDNTGNNGITGASADVSVLKTLTTAGPFTLGQTISYTLFVANAGPSTATSVQVTDTPTNLTITNVSGGGCAALPCTIPSLASGADATITVTATIDADGAFDNSATVTATEPDPDPADNTDNTGNGGNTTPTADMSLTKTLDTAGPFTVGQTITYTIVVTNSGPSIATTVQVTDIPTNLTITNVSGGGCAALPCTIASMASGDFVTITVTATINASGAFDNSATVSATETESNFTNNTDSIGNGGIAPPTGADLAITKTASANMVIVGDTFDFTLVVVNNGPDTATGVVVTDPLPPNFSLNSATPTQGSCSGTTTVTCNLGTLLDGASATITINGTVTSPDPMTNTATVSGNEVDPTPANNSSTASIGPGAGIPTVSEIGLMLLAVMLAIAGALVMRAR